MFDKLRHVHTGYGKNTHSTIKALKFNKLKFSARRNITFLTNLSRSTCNLRYVEYNDSLLITFTQFCCIINSLICASVDVPSIGPRAEIASDPAALAWAKASGTEYPARNRLTKVAPKQSPAPVGSTTFTGYPPHDVVRLLNSNWLHGRHV